VKQKYFKAMFHVKHKIHIHVLFHVKHFM